MQPGPPDLTLESDASMLGWGASMLGSATGGLWSSTERNLHINVLEMLSGTFAIKAFAKDHSNIHIRLKMDNTSAVAYVNHMGGTQSHKLSDAAKDLWTWWLNKGMTVSAEYLPGELNTTADFYSRSITGSAEWKLDPYVFKQVARRFAPNSSGPLCNKDQHPAGTVYFLEPDPFAMAVDALMTPWTNLQGYAFPPFEVSAEDCQ